MNFLRDWEHFDNCKVFKKGGGGGGSGKVSYAAHMTSFHTNMLDHATVDTITSSLVDIQNAATGASPFAGAVSYDPDVPVAAMIASTDDFQTLVDLLSAGTGLDAIITDVLSDVRIDDSVTEYSADLGIHLTAEVLPRFEAGMRDINAVVSSAWAIGRAVIEDGNTRQVARYSADLHMKAWGDDALRLIGLKLDYQKSVTQLISEANRIKIVAKKEQAEADLSIDESDILWDIKLFQHGANLLASIGGGTVIPKSNEVSKGATALGGAMSGAAAGFMISGGNPVGAAIGGVVGAASAFL